MSGHAARELHAQLSHSYTGAVPLHQASWKMFGHFCQDEACPGCALLEAALDEAARDAQDTCRTTHTVERQRVAALEAANDGGAWKVAVRGMAKATERYVAAEARMKELEEMAEALWICPDCAFSFSAEHTDEPNGGYSCPLCRVAALESAARAAQVSVYGYRRLTPEERALYALLQPGAPRCTSSRAVRLEDMDMCDDDACPVHNDSGPE